MRVVVALSGGVDSSVAAAMLKEQGHEVIGITLRLYDCDEGQNARSCCGLSGVAFARAAADALDIPHYVVDGQDLFERSVLRYAWEEYADGRTPNPCVACNEWMKFGLLYDRAQKLGADYVATGHHARIEHGETSKLLRGHDHNKDQTYFLFSLSREQLRMSLLPIGDITKQQVRDLAKQHNLPNATRVESQDACIAQRSDLAEALRTRFDGESRAGFLRDTNGKVLGRHQGIHRFTIGQRKGLGVALGERAYVVAINRDTADVVIGGLEHLAATGLLASRINWLDNAPVAEPTQVQVKIRYRHDAVPATIEPAGQGSVRLTFEQPQRAVTPGQAAVFYQDDFVLGGGWIDRALVDSAHRDVVNA